MKRRELVCIVAVLFIIATLFAGCKTLTDDSATESVAKNDSTASSTEPEKKILIAYSDAGLANSWRVLCTEDMVRAAEENGLDIITADGQMDPAKQLSDVANLLAQKPDVIIVAPCESQAMNPVVEMCDKANVPLIIIDRTIVTEPGTGMYITEIVQSHEYSGKMLAEKAAELLTAKYGTPKGSVVKLQGAAGASPVIDAQRGWDGVMADYPDIKVIDVQDTGFTKQGGMSVMENFLQAHPEGTIDIVWSDYSDMTMGGIQAIKDAERTELYGYVVGEGGHIDAIKAVLDGIIARETQTPPYFGDVSIKCALDILAGKDVQAKQEVSILVFDSSDLAPVQEYYDKISAAGLEF